MRHTLATFFLLANAMHVLAASDATVKAGRAHPKVLHLIEQRLDLMPDVAAYKWHVGLPIDDPAREALVLNRAANVGLSNGLSPDAARHLFAVQIDAAKIIQRAYFSNWEDGQTAPPAPDLQTETRPALLRLGDAIIEAWRTTELPILETAYHEFAQTSGLDEATCLRIIEALNQRTDAPRGPNTLPSPPDS